MIFSKPIVPLRAALLHRARLKLCANLQDTYCVSHLRLDRDDNKIPKRHSPVQILFRALFWNWSSLAHVMLSSCYLFSMLQLLFTQHSPLAHNFLICNRRIRQSPEFHAEIVITRTTIGPAFQLLPELPKKTLRPRE